MGQLKAVKNEQPLDSKTMEQIIGRDASPKRELKPPVFEEERIDFTNKNITWWASLMPANKIQRNGNISNNH